MPAPSGPLRQPFGVGHGPEALEPRVERGAVVVLLLRPQIPLLRQRDPECVPPRGVESVRHPLAGDRFHERCHPLLAELREQVVEEERAVRVLPRPTGPLRRAAGRLPDVFETTFDRRGTQHHLVEGPFHATGLSEVGLVPRRDALRDPAWRAASREERPRTRYPSEHSTGDSADEVARPVQVHDVCELVRDDELHPVVEICEGGIIDGRTRENGNAIRRGQLSEPIGDVDVVRHQQVDHPARCLDELSGELVVCALRDAGGSAPQCLQLGRERHPEVVCLERTPRFVGRHLGGHGRDKNGEQNNYSRELDNARCPRHPFQRVAH